MDQLTKWLDAERGRRAKLASRLGIFPSALSQWSQIPADRVLEVERVTGIDRRLLRPDLASIFERNGEADGAAA